MPLSLQVVGHGNAELISDSYIHQLQAKLTVCAKGFWCFLLCEEDSPYAEYDDDQHLEGKISFAFVIVR